MVELGARIREIRERKGIKQVALARALKVPPTTFSNYEVGPNKVPAARVPQIAAALGVTICELYGVEEGHPFAGAVSGAIAAAETIKLANMLGVDPERIEINVYTAGIAEPEHQRPVVLPRRAERQPRGQVPAAQPQEQRVRAEDVPGRTRAKRYDEIFGPDENEPSSTGPEPSPPEREARPALRFMRDVIKAWATMDEAERQEWRQLAAEIRQADEEPSS